LPSGQRRLLRTKSLPDGQSLEFNQGHLSTSADRYSAFLRALNQSAPEDLTIWILQVQNTITLFVVGLDISQSKYEALPVSFSVVVISRHS
jgi:hypothetical protein